MPHSCARPWIGRKEAHFPDTEQNRAKMNRGKKQQPNNKSSEQQVAMMMATKTKGTTDVLRAD